MYVGVLRSFKLGYFRGLNINTISALGMHLYESGDGLKHEKRRRYFIGTKQFNDRTKKDMGSDTKGRYGTYRPLWI